MIKDVASILTSIHLYRINAKRWARLAKMCKRYGEEIVSQAIREAPFESKGLDHLFNMVELRCQKIIESSDSKQFNELLKIDSDFGIE